MSAEPTPPAVRQSPLAGALTRLEPVKPEHADLLRRLAAAARQTRPYLFDPAQPAAADGDEAHFADFGLVKLAIHESASAQAVGLCMAYDYNSRDRVASLSLDLLPACGPELVAECAGLLINYVFANWDLRKLYAYSSRFPRDRLPGRAAAFFREEGCLRGHYIAGAQTWDDAIHAFYRRDLAAFNAAQGG